MSAASLVQLPFAIVGGELNAKFNRDVAKAAAAKQTEAINQKKAQLELEKNFKLQELAKQTAKTRGAAIAKYGQINGGSAQNALQVIDQNQTSQADYINNQFKLAQPIAPNQNITDTRASRYLQYAASLL